MTDIDAEHAILEVGDVIEFRRYDGLHFGESPKYPVASTRIDENGKQWVKVTNHGEWRRDRVRLIKKAEKKMDEDSLHIEGIIVSPGWPGAKGRRAGLGPAVFVKLNESYETENGTIEMVNLKTGAEEEAVVRRLTPDQARTLAQKLTLAAEAAEHTPIEDRPTERPESN